MTLKKGSKIATEQEQPKAEQAEEQTNSSTDVPDLNADLTKKPLTADAYHSLTKAVGRRDKETGRWYVPGFIFGAAVKAAEEKGEQLTSPEIEIFGGVDYNVPAEMLDDQGRVTCHICLDKKVSRPATFVPNRIARVDKDTSEFVMNEDGTIRYGGSFKTVLAPQGKAFVAPLCFLHMENVPAPSQDYEGAEKRLEYLKGKKDRRQQEYDEKVKAGQEWRASTYSVRELTSDQRPGNRFGNRGQGGTHGGPNNKRFGSPGGNYTPHPDDTKNPSSVKTDERGSRGARR